MYKVYCENNFCIYCNNHKCICSNIHLNSVGLCEDGIHIDIEDDVIKSKKIQLLKNLELNTHD